MVAPIKHPGADSGRPHQLRRLELVCRQQCLDPRGPRSWGSDDRLLPQRWCDHPVVAVGMDEYRQHGHLR